MQIGVGDHSVNNLASHVMARAIGVPLFNPSPQPVWGLSSVNAPADDGLVLVDFKLDPAKIPGIYRRLPTENEKNDVHEGVRRHPKIKQQIDQFFQPGGLIQNTCAGPACPCRVSDSATGAWLTGSSAMHRRSPSPGRAGRECRRCSARARPARGPSLGEAGQQRPSAEQAHRLDHAHQKLQTTARDLSCAGEIENDRAGSTFDYRDQQPLGHAGSAIGTQSADDRQYQDAVPQIQERRRQLQDLSVLFFDQHQLLIELGEQLALCAASARACWARSSSSRDFSCAR